MLRSSLLCLTTAAACAIGFAATPASALTTQECSAKYQAAKAAGTLGGQNWNAFRKAQCGANAAPAPAANTTETTRPAAAPKAATAVPAPAPAAVGNAVFPTAIAPKYASEKPAKARWNTCLDQYRANKANNANGSLNWIQKGGGYYSECNKRLKS